jgi:hypothetical protein
MCLFVPKPSLPSYFYGESETSEGFKRGIWATKTSPRMTTPTMDQRSVFFRAFLLLSIGDFSGVAASKGFRSRDSSDTLPQIPSRIEGRTSSPSLHDRMANMIP